MDRRLIAVAAGVLVLAWWVSRRGGVAQVAPAGGALFTGDVNSAPYSQGGSPFPGWSPITTGLGGDYGV